MSDTQTEKAPRKNVQDLTFTDAEQLSRYITDTGKILPRRITGLSAKHQRRITQLIKRGRNMLLIK